MEDTNQGSAAALGDAAQPVAQDEPGGSGGEQQADEREQARTINDLFRQAAGARSTLKPDTEPAPDGGSAPQGDVKPSGPERGADGKFVPRRGVSAALASAPDPAAIREQARAELLAEQQRGAEESELQKVERTRSADVTRYRTLRDVPDADLAADDYIWREDFKSKLRAVPEVEAIHGEYTRQEIARAATEQQQREQHFLSEQAAQIGRVAKRYGVDPEQWKAKGVTFESMTHDAVEAGRAPLLEQLRTLEAENAQLKLTGPRGLAAARSGLNGGASGAAAPPQDMNDRIFGAFRRAAAH